MQRKLFEAPSVDFISLLVIRNFESVTAEAYWKTQLQLSDQRLSSTTSTHCFQFLIREHFTSPFPFISFLIVDCFKRLKNVRFKF